MRKPVNCKYENKGADQLQGNHAPDQCLCFHYIAGKISLLPKSKFQASSHPLLLYSPVCVGPGRNPGRQVFSGLGSYLPENGMDGQLWYKVSDKFPRRGEEEEDRRTPTSDRI